MVPLVLFWVSTAIRRFEHVSVVPFPRQKRTGRLPAGGSCTSPQWMSLSAWTSRPVSAIQARTFFGFRFVML